MCSLKAPITPVLKTLHRLSPSLANTLRQCRLRAATDNDNSYNDLKRPHVSSSLGSVCHLLFQDVNNGMFDDLSALDASAIKLRLAAEFDKRVLDARDELVESWDTIEVPDPQRWPGYQMARVRILRYIAQKVVRRAGYSYTVNSISSDSESWISSTDGMIVGRIDLVEQTENSVELIDLKSGQTNGSGEAEEIRPEYKEQLMLYAYMWNENNGNWPDKLSVQTLDGNRISFSPSPDECLLVAREATALLRELNEEVENGVSPSQLANPSPDNCKYCPYQGGCDPFLEAIKESWDWYKKCVYGCVQEWGSEGQQSHLDLTVLRGNTGKECVSVRVLGIREDMHFQAGDLVSIVGALPTLSEDNLRASWDTLVWRWAQ